MSNESPVGGLLATLDEEAKKRAQRTVEAELMLEKLKLGDDDKRRLTIVGNTIEYREWPAAVTPSAVITYNPDAESKYDRYTPELPPVRLMSDYNLGFSVGTVRRAVSDVARTKRESAKYRELMEGELSRILLRHIQDAQLDVCKRGFEELLDELGAEYAAPERHFRVTVSMNITTEDPDVDLAYEVESALEGVEGAHGIGVSVSDADPF